MDSVVCEVGVFVSRVCGWAMMVGDPPALDSMDGDAVSLWRKKSVEKGQWSGL